MTAGLAPAYLWNTIHSCIPHSSWWAAALEVIALITISLYKPKTQVCLSIHIQRHKHAVIGVAHTPKLILVVQQVPCHVFPTQSLLSPEQGRCAVPAPPLGRAGRGTPGKHWWSGDLSPCGWPRMRIPSIRNRDLMKTNTSISKILLQAYNHANITARFSLSKSASALVEKEQAWHFSLQLLPPTCCKARAVVALTLSNSGSLGRSLSSHWYPCSSSESPESSSMGWSFSSPSRIPPSDSTKDRPCTSHTDTAGAYEATAALQVSY